MIYLDFAIRLLLVAGVVLLARCVWIESQRAWALRNNACLICFKNDLSAFMCPAFQDSVCVECCECSECEGAKL